MNLENIKKAGARKGLTDEATDIINSIEALTEHYKWYECEQKAKDLQQIYAELLALSKQS